MLTTAKYKGQAVLFVWGVCSGTLAVAITILKQALII